MPRILIIADDLTGANDTAVQFAERGLHAATLLCTREGVPAGDLPSTGVLAVSTESRNLGAAQAVDTVMGLTRRLLQSFSPDIVFKKIDSTLRGNVGAETRAVADILRTPVVVAPAYPQNGRTVRDGLLLVEGKPLSETYAARDVLAPVKSSYVPDYFQDVASSPDTPVTVADAETQGDLESLVASHIDSDRRVLWVGSAGLAQALAASLSSGDPDGAAHAVADKPRPEARPAGHGPHGLADSGRERALVLFGSLNPVAVAQVEAMNSDPACELILPGSETDLTQAIGEVARSGKRIVIVATYRVGARDTGEGCPKAGPRRVADPEMAATIRSFFGELAQRAIASGEFACMVMSGGDVAYAVLRSLGASAIDILEEVLPGVAFGRVLGGSAGGIGVVTKAGGFGDAGTLRDILGWVRR